MALRFDEVKTLPYAILEIKTQADAPDWVTELKVDLLFIHCPYSLSRLTNSFRIRDI